MPRQQTFTQEEWESHRTELKKLYVDEGKNLREIMVEIGEKYSFWPSKSQYETAFNKWNCRKNLNKSDWEFVNQRTNKRKADNKESEVYLNGALIPAKKVKKELDRNFPPCFESYTEEAPSPRTPPYLSILTPRDTTIEPSPDIDVQIAHYQSVQTPKNLSISDIRLDTLPWFKFQKFLESQTHVATQIFHTGKSQVRPPLLSFLDKVTSTLSAFDCNFQLNLSPAQLGSIESVMQGISLERNPGDFQLSIQKLLGPFDSDALIEFFRYLAYLSSNNMLPRDRSNQFLQWVIETNNHYALEVVLSAKMPTISAFARCLFESALQIQDAAILRALLKAGVDPSLPMMDGKTPLQAAVEGRSMELVRILLDAHADIKIRTKVLGQYDIERWQTALSLAVLAGGVEMVKMLLDAGADTETLVYEDLENRAVYCSGNPLQRAAAVGNVGLVRFLLGAGADVNARRVAGVRFEEATVLQKVASEGSHELSIELARLLVEADANVNAPGYSNDSALCWAAQKGQVEIVKMLLDSGADVNNCAGRSTPLISAAMSDSVATVRMLLDAGANVNAHLSRPSSYHTALEAAVHSRRLEIARVLLGAGADVNSPAAPSKHNPLTQAACGGSLEIVRMLLESGAEVNAVTPSTTLLPDIDSDSQKVINSNSGDFRRTALQGAIGSCSDEIVEMLLAAGADANCPADLFGYKPLKDAARQGRAEIVRMLLDSGAEVNAGSGSKTLQPDYDFDSDCESDRDFGFTALQAAAKRCNVEIVRMLLGAGADAKAPENSPLPWAARADWLGIALELNIPDEMMDEQMDKEAIDFDDESAFALAIKGKQKILVQVLLNAGADVNAMDWHDRTALELAIHRGHGFLAKPLLKAGADVNAFSPSNGRTALRAAVQQNDINLLRKLLGASKKAGNRAVSDALPLAARNGNIKIVQLLIAGGADVNASAEFEGSQDKDGCIEDGELAARSALLCAAWSGNVKVVEVLLNSGANVNAGPESYAGWTPLQAAAYRGNVEIVHILLGAGADINAPPCTAGGRTALQAAVFQGHTELVPSLLIAGADANAPAAELWGVTALQGAAINGHLGIALTLIQAAGDPDAPPAKYGGRTALEGAAEHGRLDMVAFLIGAGADISDLKRASGLAEENRHFVIVEYLKTHCNTGAM